MNVHHKDENPQNNTPENLEPMIAQEHRSLHGKKSSLVTAHNGSDLQRERIRELHREGTYDIRTLLLTLFYRHIPELILGGYLYVAQPPLYRIETGKTTTWVYDESQLKEILDDLKDKRLTPVVSRFKGLGEMPPEVLWKTTMDPENRIMVQVDIDSIECDELFQILMGEQVEPRADFIIKNSLSAELDI